MKLHRDFLPVLVCLVATSICAVARGNALQALAEQADLTPEKLIRSFSDFAFELNAEPQDPDAFLQRKRGDCDDFAALASRLLSGRGFKTKLVVVMMQQQTHVVCYVKEARGFLDFNHRRDAHPVVESTGSLEDIADKVAGDFRSHWHMAAEFQYEKKTPVYVNVVFPEASGTFAASSPAASEKLSRSANVPVRSFAATSPALSENPSRSANVPVRTFAPTNVVSAALSAAPAAIAPEKIARAGEPSAHSP